MSDNDELFQEFLQAFEEVFDRDWAYTKVMLGISEDSAEQTENLANLGLEAIHIIHPDGSFLNPLIDDEIEDWGNRGHLLELYREVVKRRLENK